MDAAVPPPTPGAAGYPAVFELDRADRIAWWRPLVHWLLIIPHAIVLSVLGLVAEVVSIVAWFAILFTAKLPQGLGNLVGLYIRYSNRVNAYYMFMREEYPPFSFTDTPPDPGDYPAVRTSFEPVYEGRNRLTTFFRFILAIPHFVCLAVLGIVAFFATIGGFFAVLFTRKWPIGLQDFILGVLRWNTRGGAYALRLTDEYPPFSME